MRRSISALRASNIPASSSRSAAVTVKAASMPCSLAGCVIPVWCRPRKSRYSVARPKPWASPSPACWPGAPSVSSSPSPQPAATAAVPARPPRTNLRRPIPIPARLLLETEHARHGGEVLGQLAERGAHRRAVLVGELLVGDVAAAVLVLGQLALQLVEQPGDRLDQLGVLLLEAGVSRPKPSRDPSTLAAKSHRSVWE